MALQKFKNNKFYFLRPVDDMSQKDSREYTSFRNFDYYFTLKKDGTAIPALHRKCWNWITK
jgi:hypothetical protein